MVDCAGRFKDFWPRGSGCDFADGGLMNCARYEHAVIGW